LLFLLAGCVRCISHAAVGGDVVERIAHKHARNAPRAAAATRPAAPPPRREMQRSVGCLGERPRAMACSGAPGSGGWGKKKQIWREAGHGRRQKENR
jgi:hypothetical protein